MNRLIGELPEIKPCRKCGSTDYKMWDGRGTQAELYCNECGQSENIQVSDLWDYGEKPKFSMETLRYPDEAIEQCKAELINEWNKRV